MEVVKGTDRIVFVGERYTVKVARSSPQRFLGFARRIRERSGLKGVVDSWQGFTADQYHSLKHSLFHGIVANRREKRLAEYGEGVVVPTVSILRGLVNIQPTATPTGLDFLEILPAFVDHLGHEVATLGHMVENPSNLGVINGQVKFVDGGSRGLEDLVQTQPEAIRHALGSLTLRLA